MYPKVFISHSSKDHQFVDWLCKNLETDSIEYFRDDRDILVGDSLTQKIALGLETSDFFIVVLSPVSIASPWVQRELSAALMQQVSHRRIVIVPILLGLELSNIPVLLQDIKAVKFDLVDYDISSYEQVRESMRSKAQTTALCKYQDSLLDNFVLMDGIISKTSPTKMEVRVALELLQGKGVYRQYFFSRTDKLHWFNLLKLAGFFSIKDIPLPRESDSAGFYSIPQWDVLPYLEKVAQQIAMMPESDLRSKYEDELLLIIRNVSQRRYEILKQSPRDMTLDNYNTWYIFAKILAKLPKGKISNDIIDCFATWLDSRFDSTLPISEILNNVLPQFLVDNASSDDIRKAERITSILLQTKEDESKRSQLLLGERKKLRFSVDEYWLKDAYTSKGLAAKIGERCSVDFILNLADAIKNIIDEERVYWFKVNLNERQYLFTTERRGEKFVCEVKSRCVTLPQDDFLTKATSFADTILKMDAFIAQDESEFRDKILAALENSGLTALVVREIASKLGKHYAQLWCDYSYIWYKSLYTSHMSATRDPEAALIQILRDILNAQAKANPQEARNIFKELSGPRYPFQIFRRLVLYCYGSNYIEYRNDFWELARANRETIFEQADFESEVHLLLQNNLTQLSIEEKEVLKKIISSGPLGSRDSEQQKLYWRQTWYSALIADPDFAVLYEACVRETKIKEFLNFRDSGVRVGPGPSPLTKEDVLKMSNSELAEFIPKFEAKRRHSWDAPNPEALSYVLQEAVAEAPNKFTKDLNPFLNLGYRYVYSLVQGFDRYVGKNGDDLDWARVLDFLQAYMSRPGFWDDKFLSKDADIREANHGWVIGAICMLLQAGTKDDVSVSIPPNLNTKVESILCACLRVIPEKPSVPGPNGMVSDSLNSNEGKLLLSVLYLSLRIARLDGKQGPVPRWKSSLKTFYEEVLAQKVLEGYTILGEHLSFFLYLDKEWTISKIREFKTVPKKLWEAFMTGFLYGQVVYDDYYELMFLHYQVAIEYEFMDKNALTALAQHAAIFYLRGLDKLEKGGLAYTLIEQSNYTQMERFISFLWMQRQDEIDENLASDSKKKDVRKKFQEDACPRIITVWEHLVKRYKVKKSLSNEDKEILADLSKLAVFLPKLDSVSVSWINDSVPYLKPWGDISFLLEYLNRLKDIGNPKENAEYISEMFVEIIKYNLPDYKREDVGALLEFLFINGQKKSANHICNIYAEKRPNLSFVREIWEKYRDS